LADDNPAPRPGIRGLATVDWSGRRRRHRQQNVTCAAEQEVSNDRTLPKKPSESATFGAEHDGPPVSRSSPFQYLLAGPLTTRGGALTAPGSVPGFNNSPESAPRIAFLATRFGRKRLSSTKVAAPVQRAREAYEPTVVPPTPPFGTVTASFKLRIATYVLGAVHETAVRAQDTCSRAKDRPIYGSSSKNSTHSALGSPEMIHEPLTAWPSGVLRHFLVGRPMSFGRQ
jgi:hypothetical protein